MTAYEVPDLPKMLRETLCVAQQRILSDPHNTRRAEHSDRLQRLINECDRHRPLGSDGKHGDRHTPTCGCEDNPAAPPADADGQCGAAGPDGLRCGRRPGHQPLIDIEGGNDHAAYGESGELVRW